MNLRTTTLAALAAVALSFGSISTASANDLDLRLDAGESHLQDLNAGVASSMALGMPQMDTSYDAGVQVAVSGATYRNSSAAAVSMGVPLHEGVFVNGTVSRDSRNETAAGVSVTLKLNGFQ